MTYSIIGDTDSYKFSHFTGYPVGTTEMYSYLESRGGHYQELLFFGLLPILKRLRKKVNDQQIKKFRRFSKAHGVPFNEAGWDGIKKLGYLPVEIKAVKEGTLVPTRNVMLTIRNTLPEYAWLTSYLETMLLRIWYPITVATRIHNMKKKVIPFFERTGNLANVPFAILDFSSRGVTCYEQSEVGGSAYLANFLGSDNVPAVLFTNAHYKSKMSGFSVAATEHSIMCSFRQPNEFYSFEYLIDNMMPNEGILSVVSDTWNIFQACDYWNKLAPKVKAKGGTLVVRPDSGEIEDVLPTVLAKLMEGFGYTVNDKGFKVLNNVKVLWGDGINEDSCTLPFEIAERMGISADSIITGSGGGLMQVDINRDTAKFAIKGSNVIINGESFGIAKDPITDPGKQSKKGKLRLVSQNGAKPFTIGEEWTSFLPVEEMLETVFLDGKILRTQTLDEIRQLIGTW